MARRRTRSMRTLCVALTGIATIATSALSGQRMSEAVARGHRAVEDELRREPPPEDLDGRGAHGDNVVLLWNATLLDAVRAVRFAPMLTARALAVMHTCMYAYAALVDRLLSSPRYGERAAQHWLDVVRFAETEGFEYDRLLNGGFRRRRSSKQCGSSASIRPIDPSIQDELQ